MTSEQILESRITINEFLKAIVGLNEDLVRLNTENLINYVLMKDKYDARYNINAQFNVFP